MDPEILQAIKVIMAAPSATKVADLALLSPPLPTSPSSNIPDKVIMAALSPPQQKRAKLDLNLVLPPGAKVLDIIAEAPVANFFLRISAKILSISKNFCQNSTPKST